MTAGPYHPAYGLPESIRQAALLLADKDGVKTAAEVFCVAVSTVYRWKAAYAKARGERT